MPRLLVLCEYPTLLGGERSMLSTLPAVAAAGFEVIVAAPATEPLASALTEHGVWHVPWQARDGTGERRPLDVLRAELAGLIAEVQPAIVHANSLSTSRILGRACCGSEIARVGHLRDIAKLSRQVVDDLNQLDRLFAVSRATREFHVAQGLNPEKSVIVYNGVDLEEFRPRARAGYLRRELRLAADARLVAIIGQLGLRKATDVALKAAAQVARDVAGVHWLVVGERTSEKDESREFEARLRFIAHQPPLAGHVHFLGPRSDIAPLLNECDLLVHAARQEPLGRVLLEAAASGLAVVATDVGGTREIFPAETETAILVPPDDAGELSRAIVDLLQNEARRHLLADAARRRAEEAFDIRIAAARLVEQYRQAMGEGGSCQAAKY